MDAQLDDVLRRLGADSERRGMDAWLGLGSADAALGREARALLSRQGDGLRAARVHRLLGDMKSAARAVEPAASSGDPEALALRGEIALLQGELDAAGRDLDAAVAGRPGADWPYAWRSALAFQRGDFEAAARDAGLFARRRPKSAAAGVIEALLAAREGDRERASKALDRAVALDGSGWTRGLRGTLRARWGELEQARADLDAAVADGAPPWALAERASVLNRLGLFWKALEDLELLRAALPGDPEPDIRAAAVHLDQAQYREASAKLTRALRLRPEDAELLGRRAGVALVQGDAEAALADLRKAHALAPAEPALAMSLTRALILTGRDDEARRQAGGLEPAARDFCLAYLMCRREEYAASAALFEKVAGLREAPESLREKSKLYKLAARTLGEIPAQAPRPGQSLLIVGLGYRQPFQVSRESLALLRGCEAFYSNLSDAAVVDFLGLLRVPLRAIVFRRADQDAIKCAKDVMPAFKTLERVAVVTRGHPLYYGRLAYRLTVMCRRRGIDVRVPGSVAIADTLPSLVDHARGDSLGMQVRNSSDLAGIDPRLPLVLYNFSGEGAWREELARSLGRHYPPTHPCAVLPGSGDRELLASSTPLKDLGRALRDADEAVTILVPARA